MLITDLSTVLLAIPFRHDGPASGFAGQSWTRLEYLLVRVETDQGLVGWGEAFGYGAIPGTRALLEKSIRPLVLNRRADDIAGLMAELKKTLHVFGRSGPMQFALSGLDIALWDIAGKQAGLPLWRLLGGGPRESVRAYASKLRLSNPADIAQSCAKAVARGFTGIKLHELTIEAVAAAREGAGAGTALMMDVNCPWTLAEATAIGRKLLPYDLAWFEEPIWPPEDLTALTRLHRATGITLAAGENVANAYSFGALAALEGVDVLQPSITKVGGVSEFAAIGRLAQLHGKTLVPHSPYFGPGYLATLQMAAVFPEMTWLEHLSVDLEQPIFAGLGSADERGNVAIPNTPGLGADPDPATIARYRVD
jgi:D-galactarolactone cycloisomerase